MPRVFRYTINGTAANGQTWETSGIVNCEFHDTFRLANALSFEQITQGRAVFGQPGTCKGPYSIHKILIEEVKQ